MRGAATALTAASMLAIVGAVFAMRGHLVPLPETDAERPPAQAEAAPQRSLADAARQARIRPVAPEIVAPPQVVPQELQRVEPREPLSRFSRPLPPRQKNQGRIFRPMVTAAGQVSGSGLTVTIAGIEVTGPDTACTDADGKNWPCGVRARAAFRAFVRGRALACDLPEELTQKEYTVACALGKQDVGAWLVGQGWAKALPGGPYAEAGEAARAEGRGIFGMAPVIEPMEIAPAAESALPTGALPPAD